MATMQKKSFSAPEETRSQPKMKAEVVTAGGVEVLKVTFEPGWKWDEHLKPSAGTKSCEVSHLNYVLSGPSKKLDKQGPLGYAWVEK